MKASDKAGHTFDSIDDTDVAADAVQVVQAFLKRETIEIMFDGSMRRATDLPAATSAVEIDACLEQEDIDFGWVMDTLLLELRANGIRVKKGDAERALRTIVRRCQVQRRKTVLRPLLLPCSPERAAMAEAAWKRLVEGAFDTEPALTISCLKHFIWQVKQKALNRTVKHHLMPVIFSPEQGSGKTTFVGRFVGPLRELAPAPVLLSDLADARSGEIFRFAALVVDDMEKSDLRGMPILKSLLTTDAFRRRQLGTSLSAGFRQRATLIGTANKTASELVPDDTGNRRFVTLQFRNGAVKRGGKKNVWDVVDTTDYELLWHSVDTFGPCPIESHLEALVASQMADHPTGILLDWLRNLDRDSEDVLNITLKGGVPARALWTLFTDQTGVEESDTWFFKAMARLVADPTVPFGRKFSDGKVRMWRFKPASS